MKLCKDCKHCVVETAWLTRQKFYYCHKEVYVTNSPVDGDEITRGEIVRCGVARSYYGDCAPEGKFWEAK
jgi:hypothetical protein